MTTINGTAQLPPNASLPDGVELRQYKLNEGNDDKSRLYIFGEKNRTGLGDIKMTFSGQLDRGVVLQDPSGTLSCKPDSDNPEDQFIVPGSHQSFGFKSVTQDANGKTHVTKIRTAALFDANTQNSRATYTRLSFEDNSYINKVMISGGDAVEACFNPDKSLKWMQVSLGGKGYQPTRFDPNTDEGKVAFVQLLQGGTPSDETKNQNGSISAEFAKFLTKTGLSPRQFLYVLGLVKKSGEPTTSMSSPKADPHDVPPSAPSDPASPDNLPPLPEPESTQGAHPTQPEVPAPTNGRHHRKHMHWQHTNQGDILTIDQPKANKTPDEIIFNGQAYMKSDETEEIPSAPSGGKPLTNSPTTDDNKNDNAGS